MKILFICTHNRCRSILAEAITNHLGEAKVIARSAGSQPSGLVHPLSLKYLEASNINTNNLKSQSWDEHEAWNPDVVITVCDSASGESCPLWMRRSIKVHWGLADPSKIEDEKQAQMAFLKTIDIIQARIKTILGWNLDVLLKKENHQQLQEKLQTLAELY